MACSETEIPNITEFMNSNSILFYKILLKFRIFSSWCPNSKYKIIDYTFHNSLQCSLNKEPFCVVQEIVPFRDRGGREGGANSSCSYDRLAIAACSLADVTFFNQSIPIQYQVWALHVYIMYDVCTHKHTHTYTHTHQSCTFPHTYSSCSTSLTLIWEDFKRHLTSVPSTLWVTTQPLHLLVLTIHNSSRVIVMSVVAYICGGFWYMVLIISVWKLIVGTRFIKLLAGT